MTILGAVREARAHQQARNDFQSPLVNPLENPELPLTDTNLLNFLGIPQAVSGVNVNQLTVLGLPSVWRALHLSSAVPAGLPFDAYRTDNESREPMSPRTQAAQLMANPHPDMDRFDFWRLVHLHRKAWGNAYLYKVKNRAGQTVELWHMHPSAVRVGRPGGWRSPKVYLFTPQYGMPGEDQELILSDSEVLHIPGLGYDGITGVSPIRALREAFGLGLAAQELGARMFGSGNLASGILQTEQRLTQKQADALTARWNSKNAGLGNAQGTVVLDKGAKFQQLTIPPDDAQFLQTRHFQVAEVCRMFGLPPFLMFETEGSTSWGTGLEQQAIAWVKFDLMSDLIPVEQGVSRLLYPSPAYAKHSVEALMRGDAKARAAFYKVLWEVGALNTNEIRAYEEKGPVEGGDVHYRPMNMGILGMNAGAPTELGAQPDPNQDPAQDPTTPAGDQ